jgi:hypothetical protein
VKGLLFKKLAERVLRQVVEMSQVREVKRMTAALTERRLIELATG